MNINIFLSGNKTLIGLSEKANELKSFSIDSRLIFQNPQLFFLRLIKALNKLDISTKETTTDNLILAIPGNIDPETGIVLKSRVLDKISNPLGWRGFNFKKSYQYLPESRIHILSSSSALAYGFKEEYDNIDLPALIISAEEELALCLINEDGSIEEQYWADETLPNFNKTPEELLNNPGLDDIIFSGTIDICEVYTDNIIKVIKSFINLGQDSEIDLKTIALFSDKTDFIYTDRLIDAFSGIHVIIPDEDQKAAISLKGCLEYLRNANEKTSQITHIEYWARNKKVYDFTNYGQFVEHFRGAKPIANPENEYRIYYLSGRIKRLKMKYLSFEEQLKSYRF